MAKPELQKDNTPTPTPEFLNISVYSVHFFPDPQASTVSQSRKTKKLPVERGVFSRPVCGIFCSLLPSSSLAQIHTDPELQPSPGQDTLLAE